jgi:hypothetical protein
MPNNSMFVLGWKTNLEYSHGVIENPEIKEPSISIVFRSSLTYTYEGFVFGPRTPFKTFKDLNYFLKFPMDGIFWTRERVNKEMIECYKKENKNIASLSIYDKIIKNGIYPF